MNRIVLIFSVFTVLALLASCKHEPFLHPVDPDNPSYSSSCSPDSVYFQNQILPILVSNCTQSGCHNAQDKQEGIVLTSYQSMLSTVKKSTLNDLSENKMMKAILDNDPDDRMPPPPSQPLSAVQINLLKTWLAQGGLNNACDENAGGCDLQTAKYSSFVQPLMQAKCQGCHSGSTPQGNINLSNYAAIKELALNGKLYASLTRASNWMPSGGAKLDQCSLDKIQQWIADGAPQN